MDVDPSSLHIDADAVQRRMDELGAIGQDPTSGASDAG
jgi:hypothetical protein